MSSVSSKYDLLDLISGMGGWYDKDGNPTDGKNTTGPLFSDIMRDFEAFKKRTGGILHQSIKVKVDEWNKDYVKSHCKGFDFIKHTEIRDDKRCKEGKKEYSYYTYLYYNKEYKDLKELNKKGVYIVKKIYFNTILELIPFLPYVPAVVASDENKTYVEIARESQIEKHFKNDLFDNSEIFCYHDRKNLSKLTQDIILNYMSDYKERTIEQEFKIEKENDKYIVHLEKPIDYNFEIELPSYREDAFIYDYPKQIDEYTLDVTNTYLDIDKQDTIMIKYVYKKVGVLWLR